MPVSDDVPYTLVIGTVIPKSSHFRFVDFWTEFEGFMDVVKLHWHHNPFYAKMARTISGNFKQLRKGLKQWIK